MIVADLFILIKKILKADIVKVFSFTAIATLIKVLTSFVSIKIVAVLIGPVGIALLGQLTNFSAVVLSLATGGIITGVTKYVAETSHKQRLVKYYISTGFSIITMMSALCGVLLIIFADFLANKILLDYSYNYVFHFFGFTIVLYALNSYLISILNGYKEFRKHASIGILTSITGLIFTVSLVWLYDLKGALISAVTYQSIIFFVSLFFVYRSSWFSKHYFFYGISKKIIKKYAAFSLMALVVAATIPTSQLYIRGRLIEVLSVEQAGTWEAMNKLSGLYLMIITTSFGVYYLPKLSESINNKYLKKEILLAYKFIIPVLMGVLLTVYILRDLIIQLVFTDDFNSMRGLFVWQLIGDFFKITSWVLAFVLIAKSRTKAYIVTELIYVLIYLILGIIMINYNGLEGVVQAYMISYIIYLVYIYIYVRKYIFDTR